MATDNFASEYTHTHTHTHTHTLNAKMPTVTHVTLHTTHTSHLSSVCVVYKPLQVYNVNISDENRHLKENLISCLSFLGSGERCGVVVV